jgi:DNA repair exonuclease SbcCD ATPase subunit
MKVSISMEALEVLEDKLGKEGAKAFIRSIDEIISEITELKWKTSKEELLNAIREEFINKNIFEERTRSIEERVNFSRSELEAKIENVRVELEKAKAELDAKIEKVRSELEAKIEKVRLEVDKIKSELDTKIDKVKSELDEKIERVRAELLSEIEKVRAEVERLKIEIDAKIDKVKADIGSEIRKLESQIQRSDMKLNFLIILTIIAIALMNPVVAEIIKSLLKI